MSFPIEMNYEGKLKKRVLCVDYSLCSTYYGYTDPIEVSGIVDVYQIGIPDSFGAEFLYRLKSGSEELKEALSSENYWGHANSRCFTPIGSSLKSHFLQDEEDDI